LADEGGQAAVEFALVLPLIALVLTVVVQLGMVYRHDIELTDAVRAGARVAAVSRSVASGAPAIAEVQQSASDLSLGTAQNPITVTPSANWAAGSDVTVAATYHDSVSILGISFTLSSSTTERVE
jgi:Flp pilus assembly protein TadG